ncbi:helix-turn-helix domain-containing protein [Kitasatospora sp. NPDC017646]|uniref:helix-turn-helix domain-containing protein n=1 Tax=Kitasatospora sp. NPDC017646 TaxID=3364024 RepID=UPI003794A4F5
MPQPDTTSDTPVHPYRMVFAERLREIRTARGLSQTRAANAARLSRPFYAGVEAGRTSISVDRLPGVADALGIKIADLFSDTPAEKLIAKLPPPIASTDAPPRRRRGVGIRQPGAS